MDNSNCRKANYDLYLHRVKNSFYICKRTIKKLICPIIIDVFLI